MTKFNIDFKIEGCDLTDREQVVLSHLIEANNAYANLEEDIQHPLGEFSECIKDCVYIVAGRMVSRAKVKFFEKVDK